MSKFKVGATVRILRIDEVIIDGTHRAGMKATILEISSLSSSSDLYSLHPEGTECPQWYTGDDLALVAQGADMSRPATTATTVLIVPEVFDGHIECQKMARYESVSRNKPIYYAQTSQGRWAMAEDTHHLPAYNFTTLRLCMPDGTHWRLA